MGVKNVVRELRTQHRHFRRHPIEAGQFVYARSVLSRHWTTEPARLVRSLGLDPEAAFAGVERWQDLFEATRARGATWQGWPTGINTCAGLALYGVVRALRPRRIIETGVAAGVSSTFIGAALADNGVGELFSIELPPDDMAELYDEYGGAEYDHSVMPGWAIPDEVRTALGSRHHLVLEDVRTALPRLLAELGDVDLFLHDDLHTVPHMLWEFDLVWPRLSPGGVLLADNTGYAWLRFVHRRRIDGALTNVQGLSGCRKPGPA